MLPIQKQFSKLDSNKTQMDFDARSLYLSAMWDENSAYREIESGFTIKPYMIDIYVDAVNN